MKLIEAIDQNRELIMNWYDTNKWNDDVSKAYLNVFQLTRFLGIDYLTFRINPDNSPFDPHHFKAFPFRKMSTHTQDIIVTSKRFHSKYDKLFRDYGTRPAQVYIETLIKCVEELLLLKDNVGNFREIKEDDVRRVLRENFGYNWEEVYNGWVSEFTEGMIVDFENNCKSGRYRLL